MFYFIYINTIIPLLHTFFTVIGGILPLVILLFICSLVEKKKLERLIVHQSKHIQTVKKLKENLEDSLAEFKNKFGDVFNIITDDTLSEEIKEILVKMFSNIRDDVLRYELEIIDAEAFINYAEKYNFWTIIADVLKRKYVGKSFLEKKLDKKF